MFRPFIGQSPNFLDTFFDAVMKYIEKNKTKTSSQLQIEAKILNKDIHISRINTIENFQWSEFLNSIIAQCQSNDLIKFNNIIVNVLIIDDPRGHAPPANFALCKIPRYYLKKKKNSLSCFYDSFFYGLVKYIQGQTAGLKKATIYRGGENIAKSCNLKYNQAVGYNEVKKIEQTLNQPICILEYPNTYTSYEDIQTMYKPKIHYTNNILFLVLHKECFFALKTPKLLLSGVTNEQKTTIEFCMQCFKFVDKFNNHKNCCFCIHCKTNKCKKNDLFSQTCERCNKSFPSKSCFDLHIQVGTCRRSKLCLVCMVEYKFNNHKCNYSTCSVCSVKYKNDGSEQHHCIMKPKKINKKAVIRVYFDIETYTDDRNGQFIPQILVSHTVCDKCENKTNQTENNFYCNQNEHFLINVFKSGTESSCVKLFINYILDLSNKHKKCTICAVAHNMSGFDGSFVYDELLENFRSDIFSSNPLKKGNKIITLHINKNIFIKDSLLFIPQKLANLPKMFDLEHILKKGFFPYLFYKKENLNYVGQIPSEKYFNVDEMNENEKNALRKFLQEKKDVSYDIEEEVVKYCNNDVYVLRACIEKFRKNVISAFALDPIAQASTIASCCFLIFINRFLTNNNTIVSIDRYRRKRYSMEALAWIKFVEKENKINLIHGRSFTGEKRIKLSDGTIIFPDGFDEENRTVYSYKGCYWHGCPECEFSNKTRNGIAGLEWYRHTLRTEESIKKDFKLVSIWSHELNSILEANIEKKKLYNDILNDLYSYEQLNPGDALFGGRTNAFRLLVTEKETESLQSKIEYYDFCSLYPDVMKNNDFPIGVPEIYTKTQCPSISEFLKGGSEKYFGLVKVKILPPRDLYIPLLPIIINKKLMFPLCFKCAHDENDDDTCTHEVIQRCWTGTYTTVELFEATKRGYIILEILELWVFERSKDLFREYINYFLKLKIEASGYPPEVKTPEQQDEYIKKYFEKEGIVIDKSNVKKNSASRTLAKLQLNNLWGKLAQNNDRSQTAICSDYDELAELLHDDDKIVNHVHVTQSKAVVDFNFKRERLVPGRYTNIPIACFTTSYGRLKLYKTMEFLGERLLYCDTDSVIFCTSPGETKPENGCYLGELTDEISEKFGSKSKGISFVSTGAKTYSLKVCNENQQIDYITRCKGFTLTEKNKQYINHDSMVKIVKGEIEFIETKSDKFKTHKYGGVSLINLKKRLKQTYNKRKLLNAVNFKTIPWGYI